ncbi:MAG: hypothetical protein ACRED7_12330 [Stellaceae bacterium]
MGSDFQRLKAKSGKQEIARLLAESPVQSEKHLERNVNVALRSIGDHKLANKIRDCGRGKVCSSLYCRKCRNRVAAAMEQRLWDYFRKALKGNAGRLQHRWRYLTVLCELTALDAKSVKRAAERARAVLKAFHRRYKDIWLRGAFEFELVDLDYMSVTEDEEVSIKMQTLLAMLDTDKSRFAGKKVLVHYHAVLDIGKYDEKPIRAWLALRYPKHNRLVRMQLTNRGQSVDEKLRKIASYGFKNRLRYNKSFVTSGYETGEYFVNKDAGKLISLYHKFIDAGAGGYKSILIGLG